MKNYNEWEVTIKLTQNNEGVCSFSLSNTGTPSWITIVGLLEIHKSDIILLSRKRAQEIIDKNKTELK